jgi:acetoin utilization deacetylase AcuC-like enzyme
LDFLSTIWSAWVEERGPEAPGLVPETFAVGSLSRSIPRALTSQPGYFCFDRFTPIGPDTWSAAQASVAVALEGAELLREMARREHQTRNGDTGDNNSWPVVYSLCRPPGHHSGDELYGGWCYLNNALIAARHLAAIDKGSGVVVLDVDYHHGNGSQACIRADDDSVRYLSIHADPDLGGEPYFCGHAAENTHNIHNMPLPVIGVTDELYTKTFERALSKIREWNPAYIILSLGCDIVKDDGVGTWELSLSSFEMIGRELRALRRPVLVVQEGGYKVSVLGPCVHAVLSGLAGDSKPQAS